MNKLTLIAAGVILLLLGCEKEKTVLIEPKIILSTDTLIFNEIESKTLYISTKPSTEGEFQVISYPDWVDVHPESGFFYNDIQEISITSNIDESRPRLYSGELIIMSTFGVDSVILQGFVGDNLNYLDTRLSHIYRF
ncbi:MAG: hypothetical protein U5L09_22460 [Bacteroidales bacterium]|nr:hypothetical protein [Bacteroidales bacterium]